MSDLTPEKALRLAIKVELVNLHVNIESVNAKDRLLASAENGWRMSDLSGLYDYSIETIIGLVKGDIDPETFLETARE